jgi:negative regulator of sigma E activity
MSDSNHYDSLFSAYLDGELNPDEQLQAERLLSENPALRLCLQQWKENGDAIRTLPKFELRADLTERVLAAIGDQPRSADAATALRTSSLAPGEAHTAWRSILASKRNWRVAMGAIASIAGMVLIAVFLINPAAPKQELAQTMDAAKAESGDPLAASVFVEATKETAESGKRDSLEAVAMDGRLAANPAEGNQGRMFRSDDEITLQESPSRPSSKSAEEQGQPAMAMRNEFNLDSLAPGRRSNQRSEETNDKDSMDEASSLAFDSAATNRERLADSLETPLPTSKAMADSALPQPVSIPQIYIVDFRDGEHPLAIVSEVFSRNQIEIFVDGPSEKLPPAKTPDRPASLQQLSSVGIEAVYVIASRGQLKRAIDELSGWADISGFQINSEVLAKMLTPPVVESGEQEIVIRMEDLIEQSSQQMSIPFERSKPDNAVPTAADLTRETHRGGQLVQLEARRQGVPGAMAQQLRPIERTPQRFDRRPESGIQNQAAKSNTGKSDNPDLLKNMIYARPMDFTWNYSPAARGGRGGAGRIAKPEGEAVAGQPENPDEELVQFLLLIRCQAGPEVNPSPAGSPPK